MSLQLANKKEQKPDKKAVIVRVICIILALLMCGGVLLAAVMSADAIDAGTPDEEERPPLFSENDYVIRVGISFRDGTLDSHRVRTNEGAPGFDLYSTTTSNQLEYIWTLYNNDVTVSETGNLRREITGSGTGEWMYYASASNTVAGGYHLQITYEYDLRSEAKQMLDALTEAASTLDIPVYPAYVDGKYRIRAGAFTSAEQAESEKQLIEEALGAECSVISPTSTGVTVIDHMTGLVLFDYDMSASKYGLGLYCLDNEGNKDYIRTVSGYYYDGVMEFRRYKASGVDGVTMIMIAELETYVIQVVPWEIYNTWPTETMKAFSICARTFAIANSHERAKHKAYDCDVCNTSDCQVCKGFSRVNQRVIDGVRDTEGEILLCDGETITTYYTDLGGGSMAAAHEVWNMDACKYLVGQMTPWEDLTASRYYAGGIA